MGEDPKALLGLLKYDELIYEIKREYYRACADRYQSAHHQISGWAEEAAEKFFKKLMSRAEEDGVKAQVESKLNDLKSKLDPNLDKDEENSAKSFPTVISIPTIALISFIVGTVIAFRFRRSASNTGEEYLL